MDHCGLLEYSSEESYEGGFLQSFREQMRGFCDVLRQKPSFPFILMGWNLISVVSLMFDGEDAGVMKLDVVPKVDAVLCHS
jgi:hypothetical protein